MQSEVPKQYLALLGRPIILHTLERLCAFRRIDGVYAGVAANDEHWKALRASLPKTFGGTFPGGATRARTVLNGLTALSAHASDDDWVMVHDAVRPCVRHEDLAALAAAAETSPDGALLAIPVIDTLKRDDANKRVAETVPRTGLWRALTPQMFPLRALQQALSAAVAAGRDVTDDSAAMEQIGRRPRLVEGHPDNIKITHPADLSLAELFLRQQQVASA